MNATTLNTDIATVYTNIVFNLPVFDTISHYHDECKVQSAKQLSSSAHST